MQHQHYRRHGPMLRHHFKRIVRFPAHQHQHLKVQRQIQMNFDAICVHFQRHDSMSSFYTIKPMPQMQLRRCWLNRRKHQVNFPSGPLLLSVLYLLNLFGLLLVRKMWQLNDPNESFYILFVVLEFWILISNSFV